MLKRKTSVVLICVILLFYSSILTNSFVTADTISNLVLKDFGEFDIQSDAEFIESTITDEEIEFEGHFNQTDEGGVDSYEYHMFRRHGNCSDFSIMTTINYDFDNQIIVENWYKTFSLRLKRNIEWPYPTTLCKVYYQSEWDLATNTDVSEFTVYMVEGLMGGGYTHTEEEYNVTNGEVKFHVWRTGDNLTCNIIQNDVIFYSRSVNNSDYLLDLSISGYLNSINQSIGEYYVCFSDFYANLGFPSTAKVGNNTIMITFTTFFGLIIIQIIKRKFKTKR